MTKRVLIIRPTEKTNQWDQFIPLFSSPAAVLATNEAIKEVWFVRELAGNNANKGDVFWNLMTEEVDFMLHYGHGNKDTIFGQNNNNKEAIIDSTNVEELKDKAVSSTGCYTAAAGGIGTLAISKGARAYLGYNDTYYVWHGKGGQNFFTDYFIEAANAANRALLEGKTFQEAYQIGKLAHEDGAQQILNSGLSDQEDRETAAGCMEWCGDHLTLLGNPNAKAKKPSGMGWI